MSDEKAARRTGRGHGVHRTLEELGARQRQESQSDRRRETPGAGEAAGLGNLLAVKLGKAVGEGPVREVLRRRVFGGWMN